MSAGAGVGGYRGAALSIDWMTPELVWGVFTRSIGVCYLIAFGSLFSQIGALAGEQGITPIGLQLAAIRRDFPALRRFLSFPTLLWLGHSDRVLRGLVWLGIVASLVIIFGGPSSFWALLAAYLIFLSLDVAIGFAFPWECVLFEVGVLGLFLPATHALPALGATAAPAPALTWAFRLLLFRVVLGFGKFKFIGSSRRDLSYLKGFLINQPLPTPIAWYAHRLPLFFLKLGVLSLFWVEIPGAMLTLVPGVLGLVGGAGILGLMVVIQLSGNFGYFNVIVACLCLPLLDMQTPRELDFGAFAPNGPWLTTAFVALHTLLALCYLPWNSYLSQSWHRWPLWLGVRPRILTLPVSLARALAPFRIVHAYGVFPPKTMASVRNVAVVEISYDGQSWHELEYMRAATQPQHPPRFIAPRMARWDQTLIYETYGTTPHGLVYAVANSGLPYTHATFSHTECLLERILEGHFYEGVVFKPGTFPRREAPLLARMRVFMLDPTTPSEKQRTGNYWSRRLIGPHHAARAQNPHFWRFWLPEPELFDFDDAYWKRASVLGRLLSRAAQAGSLEELSAPLIAGETGGAGLRASDVERFWNEFLPAAGAGDWSELSSTVKALRSRYTSLELRSFERILGRIAVALEARLGPYFYGDREPKLDLPTHYHLALFTHHLVARGRDSVNEIFAHPDKAAALAPELTLESGLYLFALFRVDQLAWEAHKIRLLDAVLARSTERFPGSERAGFEENIDRTARKLWGVAFVTPFLRARFFEPDFCDGTPERYPEYVELPSGELAQQASVPAKNVQ